MSKGCGRLLNSTRIVAVGEEDVTVGEGEGQASEQVGFREALEDWRSKEGQGFLSHEDGARWTIGATSKVDAATSGLTSEASPGPKKKRNTTKHNQRRCEQS